MVDCEKLNKEIKELEERLSRVQEELESISNDNEGKKKVGPLGSEILGLEEERDRVLEEYLEEFFEKNPELQFLVGKEIADFGDQMECFRRLSDKEIIVMVHDGNEGKIKIFGKDGEEWGLKEEITGFGEKMSFFECLSDTDVMVFGAYRSDGTQKISILRKEDGEWGYKEEIKGPDGWDNILSFERLSDTEVLVKEKDKDGVEMARFLRKENDKWEYKEEIEYNAEDDGFELISSCMRISDTEILAVVVNQVGAKEVRIFRKNGEGWKIEEEIPGFGRWFSIDIERVSDTDFLVTGSDPGWNEKIRTRFLRKENDGLVYKEEINVHDEWNVYYRADDCSRISDTEILVVGEDKNGTLKIGILRKEDGKWGAKEEITGFDKEIRSIERLSDTEIIVIGVDQDGTQEVRILRKEDEKWGFKEKIDGFEVDGWTSFYRLSDTEAFVVETKKDEAGEGRSQKIRILTKGKDLAILKKNLPRMLEKND